MSSFSSGGKRKAPPQQTIIYMPPPLPDNYYTGGETETPGPTPEVVQREREQNLLRRARSSLGTVLNGFRGILAPSDSAAGQRKSLLGE